MNTNAPLIFRLVIVACLAASMAGCPSESSRTAEQSANELVQGTQKTRPSTDGVESESPFKFVKPALTEDELRAGWISLFDGSTLFGWDVPKEANWHAEDACLVADSGDICLLTAPFAFDDFEFRCDFHLAKGGNSGVFLRTADGASNPATDTYELNICDSHETHGTGSLVGRHVATDVPAVEGEWHTFHVTCNRANIKVLLDGKSIVDFTDESENVRSRGHIGLQFNKGRIAFRNVFLKPLNTTEVFNGQDLAGFHEVPGSQSTFAVVDGVIHAESGPGFLETDGVWGDFILQIEANIYDDKALAEGRPANSGVFFRAMTGTADEPSNGYEMQIQHDFKNNDRSDPLDFGSGGIYRREPARYIVANNNEWFVETLIAQGNRFATFVNGYQVLDWTDNRTADENPRKGLRLEPGHLSLQGHDPTTNLDFRTIRVHELAQ